MSTCNTAAANESTLQVLQNWQTKPSVTGIPPLADKAISHWDTSIIATAHILEAKLRARANK